MYMSDKTYYYYFIIIKTCKKRAAKPKTGGICCLVFVKPMPLSGSNARTAIRWELSGCLSEIS